MNIGAYSFEEFRQLAANFHGYAAPGLLIGGYMVEMAKRALPEGTLFEAVVESAKCLPDAVQLLSACSTGNQRLKVHNLGRYAVSLFDKYTGEGFRVSLDAQKMRAWPELYAWFFKQKPKKEQDSARLENEIRQAGDSICVIEPVTIRRRFMGARHMRSIAICPQCGEAYPGEDGPVCRGCRGEAPYVRAGRTVPEDVLPAAAGERVWRDAPGVRVVPVEQAVGHVAAHDMTRIEPGAFKGPEFRAGQRISVGDICRLQQMGRFHVAVLEEPAVPPDTGSATAPEGSGPEPCAPAGDSATGNPARNPASGLAQDRAYDLVHENDAAEAFAKAMAGDGVTCSLPPKEGKIDFRAARDGLFCVNRERLEAFNLVPEVMAACRQDATLVREGAALAGTRAIPLFLHRQTLEQALDRLTGGSGAPLFEVRALRRARVGILVTGTEVFQGIIKDKFIPVISAKVVQLGSEVVASIIAPDEASALRAALDELIAAGADLIVTTGGLSVDPDDLTRQTLLDAGLRDVVHGVPVLPGTMSLVGMMDGPHGPIQVVGVPACALYYKTTFFDLVLPRLLAGREFTRLEAALMGEGGYCLSCKVCSWPKCSFGK